MQAFKEIVKDIESVSAKCFQVAKAGECGWQGMFMENWML